MNTATEKFRQIYKRALMPKVDEDVKRMEDYAREHKDEAIADAITNTDAFNDGLVLMPSQQYGLMSGAGNIPMGNLAKAGATLGAATAGIMAGEELKKKLGKGRTELVPPDVPTGTPAIEPTDTKTGETETMPEVEKRDNTTTLRKDPKLDELRKSLPFPVDSKTFEDLIEFMDEYPEVADVAGKMKAHRKTVEAWQKEHNHQNLTWDQIQEILETVSQQNAVRNWRIRAREEEAKQPKGKTYEQKKREDLAKGEHYTGIKHSSEPSYSKMQEAEDFAEANGSADWNRHHPRKTLRSDNPSK